MNISMFFEINGLGSNASSTSCGFKTLTYDFPLHNYVLLFEQLDNSSHLLPDMLLVQAIGSGWVSGKPFHTPEPVQIETTLKRSRQIGLNPGPV